jgi:hypothetical protein
MQEHRTIEVGGARVHRSTANSQSLIARVPGESQQDIDLVAILPGPETRGSAFAFKWLRK